MRELIESGLPPAAAKSLASQFKTSIERGTATAPLLLAEWKRLGKQARDPLEMHDCRSAFGRYTPPPAHADTAIENSRAKPQVSDPRPGEMFTRDGKPLTPWRDFAAAGFNPKRHLTDLEWKLVAMFWRFYFYGCGDRDWTAIPGEPVPFLPSLVVRKYPDLARSASTVKAAMRRLIRWKLLRVVSEPRPGRPILVVPGWTDLETDATIETVALEQSLDLVTADRGGRKPPLGGRGKQRKNKPASSPPLARLSASSRPPLGRLSPTLGSLEESPNAHIPETDRAEHLAESGSLNSRPLLNHSGPRTHTPPPEQDGFSHLGDRTQNPEADPDAEETPDAQGDGIDWEELRRIACRKLATIQKGEE